MAIRTSQAKVADILGSNYNGTSPLKPFILTANLLTDWLVTCAGTGTLSDAELAQIEAYLAAHFYGHQDQFFASKSTGGASGSFQGQTAMILSSSYYGQTALLLDHSGCLAKRNLEALEGKRTADIQWLGSTGDESRAYDDIHE